MDRVVLDTNVVVSALIGKGNSRRILESVFSGELLICLSTPTFTEYVEVLARPKFSQYPEFTEASLSTVKHLRSLALFVEPIQRVHACSDTADDKFLELALEAEAKYVITGNKRHFPSPSYGSVLIVSPAEFFKSHKQ